MSMSGVLGVRTEGSLQPSLILDKRGITSFIREVAHDCMLQGYSEAVLLQLNDMNRGAITLRNFRVE